MKFFQIIIIALLAVLIVGVFRMGSPKEATYAPGDVPTESEEKTDLVAKTEPTGEKKEEKTSIMDVFSTGSTVDLSNKGLTQVPNNVINDRSMTKLILSNNSIESLPSQVENWKNLEAFYIENNNLKSFPGEIRHMSKLEILDGSGNGMTDLPAEIGQLGNLKTLDLSNNDIDEFPNELQNLKGLETLDIRGNPVKDVHLQMLNDALVNTNILF